MDDYYDDRAYRRHKPDQHREERDEVQFDLTKEFTCFLCNGITTCLGSVELDRGAIHFVSASGYGARVSVRLAMTSVCSYSTATLWRPSS